MRQGFLCGTSYLGADNREWFTTKPFQDAGEVRFIGSLPTPWPSWTIAASTHTALQEQKSTLNTFLHKLHDEIQSFANPTTREDGSLYAFIESVHHYKPEDIAAWASGVRWAGESTPDPSGAKPLDARAADTNAFTLSSGMLERTLQVLEDAGVLTHPAAGWDIASFTDTSVTTLL